MQKAAAEARVETSLRSLNEHIRKLQRG